MSYSPVYSAQFILYSFEAPNNVFEVPSDYTAVVRQISVVAGVDIVTWVIGIQNDDSAPEVHIAGDTLAALNEAQHAEGHWVCPGGGYITAQELDVGAHFHVYVGGYLLRNVIS